jgi:hypothetical protein
MSVFIPMPHFHEHSFVGSLKIRACASSSSVLFQGCFGSLGFLEILYEFQDWLFNIGKKSSLGFLMEIALDLKVL